MGFKILYVYFGNDMEQDAKLLKPEGEVMAHTTFLNSLNVRHKQIEMLHLIVHANWVQFHDYSVEQLAAIVLSFLTSNPQVKQLILNGCYTGDRNRAVGIPKQAFCKKVAVQIKYFLPQHEYLEIIGFTGRVFVGVDGNNHVWESSPPPSPNTLNKLKTNHQALEFYNNSTK